MPAKLVSFIMGLARGRIKIFRREKPRRFPKWELSESVTTFRSQRPRKEAVEIGEKSRSAEAWVKGLFVLE